MNATKHTETRRNSSPASVEDNNNNTSNRPATTTAQRHDHDGAAAEQQPLVKDAKKNKDKGTKTLWVTVFKCFYCGKHGLNLPKCRQCSQAYYCNSDRQRKYWKSPTPVCRAPVAAIAHHAHRLPVARAVREPDHAERGGEAEGQLGGV